MFVRLARYSTRTKPFKKPKVSRRPELDADIDPAKKDVKRSALNPHPFNYGNYSSLKDQDNESLEYTHNLIQKVTTWDSLKLLPDVRKCVQGMIQKETILNNQNFVKLVKREANPTLSPTPIQIATVKTLSKSLMDPGLQVHTLAAETGSGKTMAYLAPLLDYLKRRELDTEYWEVASNKAIIRSIILLPTHELVSQVSNTVRLAHPDLNVRSFKWDSGSSYDGLITHLRGRIDVLVTTPGKLLAMKNIRSLTQIERVLHQTEFLVMDEADTLLDKSWLDDTYDSIKLMPNLRHVLFCSATIPTEFSKTVTRLFPTAKKIVTPSIHRLPSQVEYKLIDANVSPYKGSKIRALAQVLYAIQADGTEEGFEKRCVVFVNEKASVKDVASRLERYGHDVVGLSGEDTVEDRLSKIKVFVEQPRLLESLEEPQEVDTETIPGSNITISKHKKQQSRLKVLVTTDLMARGLNFHGVRNVVLYDVPKTSVDLVHRAGRTGRMKTRGRVFIIVDKKAKSWVKAIPKVARNQIPLT